MACYVGDSICLRYLCAKASMFKLLSRFTQGYVSDRFQLTAGETAPHIQSFPAKQADLDLLKESIQSLIKQRLDRVTLLALAKSTAFEMRKNVIRLDSIGDVDTILEETDAISDLAFKELGQHIPRFRHALRQEYFQHLIGTGSNFKLDQFRLLQNQTAFPGRNQIQHEIIRRQIESHIQVEYGLPPCRDAQRISRQAISRIGKGEYAQHCLNLYNLNMPIDQKTTNRMIAWCREINLSREWDKYFQNAYTNSVPIHVVIEHMLRSNPGLQGNHNTHPASKLLEFGTGFVFHPKNAANIQQLLNGHSPAAFKNISSLLSDKFLAARACNNVQHFLETAFVQQNPCFEVTIENLLEFNPEQQPNQLTVPEAPKWTPLASTEENIEALLDWQEIAALKAYIDSNNMVVTASDHQKIDRILAAKEFRNFVYARKTQITNLIESIVPIGTPHKLLAQFEARWS